VLGTLMKAGFSVDGAAREFSLLDSYVYSVGLQQFNLSAGGDDSPEEMASYAMQKGYDTEVDFDFGLEIILTGLEQRLSEKR
jgi:hypothetical protein